MKRRKNSNLHVVREPEDPTDKIIEEIMDELNSEDGVTEKEIQEELARRKRKKQKKPTNLWAHNAKIRLLYKVKNLLCQSFNGIT